MIERDIWLALAPVVKSFVRLEIPYYIGGSVASSIYGIGRSTLGADVVADLKDDQIDAFMGDLGNDYYASQSMIKAAVADKASFNVIHHETTIKIDVFAVKSRDYDLIALTRIREDVVKVEEGLFDIVLAAPEDVVLNKIEWYEKGDRVAERQWKDVIGVLEIQKGKLDIGYLKQWAETLKLDELLQQAFDAAGISTT